MSAVASFANPIFCAIDRPDLQGASDLARTLAGTVGGLKLGLEFFVANGPPGVRQITAGGLPLFLDLKLHDIPNTVAGAIHATLALAPAMVTVHAGGGQAMLEAAVEAAGNAPGRPWLLGITALTSLDAADLAACGIAATPADHVLRMAELCAESALDGVVCSPHEISALRRRFGGDLKLVVPGIRGNGDAVGDQKRTMPAAEALQRGADILVVGRPITRAPSPAEAARTLVSHLPRAA
jgi:orotidine-5'-phosphate decarboxylase